MQQRVADWLRRRPPWIRYVAGYLLIVLLLLAVVEYRGRPAAPALSNAPPTSTATQRSARAAQQPAPARRSPAPIALTVNPTTGNPPAPTAPGARGAHRLSLALRLVCRGAAAPHLLIAMPGPTERTRTGSGVAWDLGPLGPTVRIQLTLDLAGCR